MTSNRTLVALAAAALVASLPLMAFAQPAGDPHHPSPQGSAESVPAQIPGRAMGNMPMMGGGMMGGGMPMMGGAMGGGMMGFGGMMTDHIEGRIAFLRAELKITDAQTGAWNAFADALRAAAKRMSEARQAMMKPGAAAGIVNRLDARERMLSAALDSTRAIKAGFAALDAKLSGEQKKAADELLGSPMGMGMMALNRNNPAQ